MTILTRQETGNLFLEKLKNKSNICATRFCDGEYLFMTKRFASRTDFSTTEIEFVGNLLIQAIQNKQQFVCVNIPKPHNIKNKDIYFKAYTYFMSLITTNIIYNGNWHLYDYQNECAVLPKIFSDNTLMVSGYADLLQSILPNIDIIQTSKTEAHKNYYEILTELNKVLAQKTYQNIIFSCGIIGKTIMPQIIDKTNANIIDVGSLLFAMLYKKYPNLINSWSMSWTNNANLSYLSDRFITKCTKEI